MTVPVKRWKAGVIKPPHVSSTIRYVRPPGLLVMTARIIVLTIALLTAFRPGHTAMGGEGSGANQGDLQFARSLFQERDYYGAAGEAKRFLFFHPEDVRENEARQLLKEAKALAGNSSRPVSGCARIPSTPDPGGPLAGLVHFYRNHLRTFKTSDCPSYPSCSEYTLQAMARHGAIMGTFMFVDRQFREVTTAGTPPYVRHHGRILHYDPLSANDYWLKD